MNETPSHDIVEMMPTRNPHRHITVRSLAAHAGTPLGFITAIALSGAALFQPVTTTIARLDKQTQNLTACAARQIGVPEQNIAVGRRPWKVFITDDQGARIAEYKLLDNRNGQPIVAATPLRPDADNLPNQSAGVGLCFEALSRK